MHEISPKVTIVLPTYNGIEYIQQSIDSCLNQTYKNIELIIIDDCSTVDIPKIVKFYIDNRIKYIRHQQNKGLSESLNSGFKSATGEYLTWTSDDNQYLPTAIERMVAFLETNDCEFVYCDYYTFKDNTSCPKRIFIGFEREHLSKGNLIGPCFLYSRKVRENIGDYDSETSLAEDYDYWIRVSKKFVMRHLEEPLYLYRIQDDSLTFVKHDMVRIVTYLVMAKNDATSIQQINDLFIRFIIARKLKLLELMLIKISDFLNSVLFNPKISSCGKQKDNNSIYLMKYIYKFINILTWSVIKLLGVLPDAVLSGKSVAILTSFKIGKLSFSEAKLRLNNLIS